MKLALPRLSKYWTTKLPLTQEASESIDWQLISLFLKLHWKRSRFLVQFFADHLPNNATLARYIPHYSPLCPKCSQLETQRHILSCPCHLNVTTSQYLKFH